jgi:hypothetical protein
MNAQRWIALAMLAGIVACIATSNIWLSIFVDEEEEVAEEETTPTPTVGPTATNNPFGTPTPTLDPIVDTLRGMMDPAALAIGDEPRILYAGGFTTIDAQHQGDGIADIFRLGQEQRYVLFLDYNFSVSNGPDLHVILSLTPVPRTSAETLLPEHLDLGPLLETEGAQFYPIPEGTDIEKYESVVVYSRSFNIVYTSADLEAVSGEVR